MDKSLWRIHFYLSRTSNYQRRHSQRSQTSLDLQRNNLSSCAYRSWLAKLRPPFSLRTRRQPNSLEHHKAWLNAWVSSIIKQRIPAALSSTATLQCQKTQNKRRSLHTSRILHHISFQKHPLHTETMRLLPHLPIMLPPTSSLRLQQTIEGPPNQCEIDNNFGKITNPVSFQNLQFYLTKINYDKHLSQYLVSGFRDGFRLDHESDVFNIIAENNKSIHIHHDEVKSKIQAELKARRIAGPFSEPPFNPFQTSPLNICEKKTPGNFDSSKIFHILTTNSQSTQIFHSTRNLSNTPQFLMLSI